MKKHIWFIITIFNIALTFSVIYFDYSLGKGAQVFLLVIVTFFTLSMGIGEYFNEKKKE
ncbi:hypothetical protein [Fervidibacillus halotolerans]|uniref:Uncharacterized protein n=1 Tax=Fervidibacillus halotolerans TaxID=2980027 RepID=A0A9E8M0M6_9BACI|nr:hypothetical protein [Fervidibacillus halotolerans]WAA12817.1 hypothetical protein OE105_01345 [Fervidibacillus halotolerans]